MQHRDDDAFDALLVACGDNVFQLGQIKRCPLDPLRRHAAGDAKNPVARYQGLG